MARVIMDGVVGTDSNINFQCWQLYYAKYIDEGNIQKEVCSTVLKLLMLDSVWEPSFVHSCVVKSCLYP